MIAVEANGARESGTDAWSGMLTDAVVKCGRDSERRLYMYGISSNRCPKCQARLRADNNTCVSCHYTHKTPRKCTRCSLQNNPVMWCAECDAYFCASCHKKPHVLMLGSTKPHHCFVIDGASGKHFVEAAWSDEFTAMVQATYRLRLHDKMLADEAKSSTKTTGQQATQGVNRAADQTASTSLPTQAQPLVGGASSSIHPPVTQAAVNEVSSTTTATASSTSGAGQSSSSTSPHAHEQSRKRQLPGPDDTRDRIQKSIRMNESAQLSGRPPAAPTDGMSLYDRVKAMHDMRAKTTQPNTQQAHSPKTNLSEVLPKRNDKQQRLKRGQEELYKRATEQAVHQRREDVDRIERWMIENEQNKLKRQEELSRRHHVEQRRQKEQWQQEDKRWQEEQRQQEEQQRQELRHHEEQRRKEDQRRYEEKMLQKRIQEQQRQQRLMEERMRHEQTLRQQQESRQQVEAHSLGSQYVSQAQHVLHSRPGYAVASMAPSNISAPMLQPSNARFTRVSTPVTISPHAPRFEPASASPTSQGYLFQSTHDVPVTNGYPRGNEHEAQVYQGHAGPVPRFETISQEQDGNHHLVVRNPNVQQQQQQQIEFSEIVVPRRMTTGAEAFSPSKSGEDDELRAIWVSDYDNVNALVMRMDLDITKLTEEGHQFVHRSNNITIPEQLKLQIKNLRAQREAAVKKRFESVVRVLIFSEAVRSFAQQNEHTNIWSNVPEVLKASHKKCAELATDIREFERQAQKFREGIDEAVSSGNPAQMQNVAQLGAFIADLERKIRASNGERDKQFIFMFQFSDTLRNMVRAEWAAPGRGYHLQSSQ